MPHLQVVLLFALAEYDRMFDEMIKWQREAYWEARVVWRSGPRGSGKKK